MWTFPNIKMSEHKKDKFHITFPTCKIAERSEKSKLMMIKSRLSPRAFKKTSSCNQGFQNHAKKSLDAKQIDFCMAAPV